ncbi:MAG: hypothetical protein GY814_06235 [Gammaproteobacteria bacterium]|nr:hypothetical protein [Gammaproteobacteria bacterium]
MEPEVAVESVDNQKQRNMVVRAIAAIFWLLLTMLIVNMIVGGVVGGMAGTEAGAGKSMADAANAGAIAGQQASAQFMSVHGGKVYLCELALWLALLLTGKYPWVSKYKKSKA